MIITKETMVFVNKKFANGTLINGSLDFAIKVKTDHMFGNLPHILRALLVDHSFEDGNKRTAAFLLINYCEENRVPCNEERVVKTIRRMAQTNPSEITKIRSMMKYALSSR